MNPDGCCTKTMCAWKFVHDSKILIVNWLWLCRNEHNLLRLKIALLIKIFSRLLIIKQTKLEKIDAWFCLNHLQKSKYEKLVSCLFSNIFTLLEGRLEHTLSVYLFLCAYFSLFVFSLVFGNKSPNKKIKYR